VGEIYSVTGDSHLVVVGLQSVKSLVNKHLQVLFAYQAFVDLDQIQLL
jgi:hypothetical protein